MLVGVISDTHNRIENVRKIISLFNKEKVGAVIHTGDITKAETLVCFQTLIALYMAYMEIMTGLRTAYREFAVNITLNLKNRLII